MTNILDRTPEFPWIPRERQIPVWDLGSIEDTLKLMPGSILVPRNGQGPMPLDVEYWLNTRFGSEGIEISNQRRRVIDEEATSRIPEEVLSYSSAPFYKIVREIEYDENTNTLNRLILSMKYRGHDVGRMFVFFHEPGSKPNPHPVYRSSRTTPFSHHDSLMGKSGVQAALDPEGDFSDGFQYLRFKALRGVCDILKRSLGYMGVTRLYLHPEVKRNSRVHRLALGSEFKAEKSREGSKDRVSLEYFPKAA